MAVVNHILVILSVHATHTRRSLIKYMYFLLYSEYVLVGALCDVKNTLV